MEAPTIYIVDVLANYKKTHDMKINTCLHSLRLLLAVLMCSALVWTAGGCSHRDLWDDVPGPVAEFLNQYFPYSELQSVTESGSNYHIRIDDGPGLTFDYTYSWIAIDGYGMPLPQVLLFDQLPPRLYDYLQETEQLNCVFSMERNKEYYILTLLDSSLKYTIATGEMTEKL